MAGSVLRVTVLINFSKPDRRNEMSRTSQFCKSLVISLIDGLIMPKTLKILGELTNLFADYQIIGQMGSSSPPPNPPKSSNSWQSSRHDNPALKCGVNPSSFTKENADL